MKKKGIIIGCIAAAALVAAAGGVFVWYQNETDLVYKEVYAEAGSDAPDVAEFLKRPEPEASFSKDSKFDMQTPGDYDLTVLWKMPVFGQQAFQTTLHITDTTAPVVEAVDEYTVFTYEGEKNPPKAQEFVKSITDVTECKTEFLKDYDFTVGGNFDVTLVVTDAAGNSTEASVPCTVISDSTPPVIEGVKPLEVAQGETISYKKDITVTDDFDENPTLEVDTSEVNADKRGTYNVTYTATDAAGNVATEKTTIHIVSAKIAGATEEAVYAMADGILSEIITDDMGQKEQAKAVFDWVVNNIGYSESAGMDDLLSAAYKGMNYHIGDCTVKQKTAEVMLNRLGIKNMEIEKIRDHRGHYWLLIDIGEGWYHYDPNLQLDGTLIFYWHDADLWNYSNTHGNTHNYDPSKYPHIE